MKGIKKMGVLQYSATTNFTTTTLESMKVSRERKIPAEAANIKIEGLNKWITVIQNARLDVHANSK